MEHHRNLIRRLTAALILAVFCTPVAVAPSNGAERPAPFETVTGAKYYLPEPGDAAAVPRKSPNVTRACC